MNKKKDINRIDGFLDGSKHIWKNNYDLRFGQIVLNLYNYIYKKYKIDIFFIEYDKLIKYLKEFLGDDKKNDMPFL